MTSSPNFWRNFNQFDLFPPRSTVTAKKLLGDFAPGLKTEPERSGPWRRRGKRR